MTKINTVKINEFHLHYKNLFARRNEKKPHRTHYEDQMPTLFGLKFR